MYHVTILAKHAMLIVHAFNQSIFARNSASAQVTAGKDFLDAAVKLSVTPNNVLAFWPCVSVILICAQNAVLIKWMYRRLHVEIYLYKEALEKGC